MKRAVFLDRDGVINRSRVISGTPTPPRNVEEVEILEGVVDAIKLLKNHYFVPVVVTNQPDVARGIITKEQVESLNTFIGIRTGIEYFYSCFHDDTDSCSCRKPYPGLIHQASAELNLDVSKSYMVGDRWRDVEAGQSAGCDSYFIDYSYNEKRPELPYVGVSSLLEAAQKIIGGIKSV